MKRVVVTGLGAITPLGNNVSEFWDNLVKGTCGIKEITKFDTTNYKVKLAAEVHQFDPLQYMDKMELRHTDLYAQYAMAAACQAMEDSGIQNTIAPERIGVYMGSGIGGMSTFMSEHTALLEKGPRKVSPYFIPMMIANIASGMIAIRFNCKNSAMPAVTACASGTNAIGEALRMIRHGYADAMIAGGAEATINEITAAGFTNMRALSVVDNPKTACLPFDERRSGFIMGEGAGALVLEELEHAVNRGAHIYAELCGYGSTCDAYHITAPQPEAEGGARAIADAWNELNLDTDHVYINAHGTGTPYNDAFETIAIKKVFGEDTKVPVSSTKSMTGHLLGAAGGLEAVICAKAIVENFIPPTAGLQKQDPELDLDYVPNVGRKAELNYVLSNSLGFGGHNATLIMKKYNR